MSGEIKFGILEDLYVKNEELLKNKDFSRNLEFISGKHELDAWFSKIASNNDLNI